MCRLWLILAAWCLCLGNLPLRAEQLPDWTAKIRSDHPRLFFNADMWSSVRSRAREQEGAWYAALQRRVDNLNSQIGNSLQAEPRDLGPEAAHAAFVFLMTEDPKYLDLAKRCLEISLRYYELCYERRQTVNWYSTSRVHATLAWDWLFNHLSSEERTGYLSRLVNVIDRVIKEKPAIYRENISGFNTGFYGVRNCQWFIGLTGFGAGIETERVNEWLVWGHDENLKLLQHRQLACGDDGGGASPTLGYVLGAYPWAEQNFFYTWLSATGENIAPDWPHGAWLANYVIWNWIGADPAPCEFGYGDTPHTTNGLPIGQLYTHMANIRHLYGRTVPEAAALARHVQEILPQPGYSSSWFVYPFLLSQLEQSPPALAPTALPQARYFENMGQLMMRSGTNRDDTYCLFTCGGILSQHRHFDALNFVIYHQGHLAIDSGTRYLEFDNGQHLANYYAQTVAHNCVLIHQAGEPPARYWGGTVEGNHGGQHRQLGSVVTAFETNDDFVYAAGDATACYHHGPVSRAKEPGIEEKCSLVTRQLVFLMPDHFVICDRVVTTKPEYRKEWLLHTAEEPSLEGRTIRAAHRNGQLFCRTLLPEDAQHNLVGGAGKEFWAAGKNWDIVKTDLKPEELAMMGQWRVEVTPGQPRTEDVFLHVIQVGDRALAAMDDVELLSADQTCGVRLSAAKETWEVTFATSGKLAGHVRRTGAQPAIDRDLTTGVQPQAGILARATTSR
jgi:heparin/heparan-sulfate lyase